MKISARVNARTPKFYRTVRNIGLVLAAVAGVIAAAPVALPAVIVSASGYLALAASVAAAVSQTTVLIEPEGEKHLIQEVNARLPLDAAISVGIKAKTAGTPGQLISETIQQTRVPGFVPLKGINRLI